MDTRSDSPKFDLALDRKRALLAELLQEKAGRPKSVPLSFAQQRLWFLNQLAPNSPFYNVSCTITLTGVLQKGVLEQSLNELVRRHEVLRTRFVLRKGHPVQLIDPASQVLLPIEDLTPLSIAECKAEVQRLSWEEVRCPFDLARGPLLRAQLLQVRAEECVLLLSMHHIVADGWSLGVLFHELGALYAAFSIKHPSPLPELPIQYADYTRWQREWLAKEALTKQLAYWQEQLADLPQLVLPTDRPRPEVQSFSGAYEPFRLPSEITAQLKTLSQQEGVTLFMTLLAGFSLLLSRYSGQEDIVVGTGAANRTRSELEGLIGFFINTLVLRTNLSGDPTVRELLRRVREMALSAYAHQDVPFEQLVEKLHPHRDPSQNPLFQVILALQNAPFEPLELSGLKLHLSLAQSGTTKFDLYLSLWESAGELSGLAEYSTDLFEASTIRRMLGHYLQILTAMVAHPADRLSTLQFLTEAEHTQLQVWKNATQKDRRTIHVLEEAYIAPRNHIEEMLAGVWAEVLGLERVGVNNNFFDLGGHSLLATQVIIRMRETLQQDVPLSSLFEYPTVARLAQILQANQEGQRAPLPLLHAQLHPDVLPLSFAQEQLWFLAQLENEAPSYTMTTAYVLNGMLQVKVLEQSFSELIRRHEVLRTRFVLRDERPVQLIEPAHSLSLPLIDLTLLLESERKGEARRLAIEEAQQAFDLSRDPLLRARLARLGEGEHVLLLSMHHIISDGWSLSIFVRELSRLYASFSSQGASPLPDLSIQYADYTLWQRQWLSNSVLQELLDYWKQQLADLPYLALPSDHQRKATQRFRGRYFRFRFSLKLTQAIKQLSQREGVTLFMTLLAGFHVLLSRYSGQEDIAVGTPIANRAHSELENLIGLFVNTLVLRLDLSGDPSMHILLERVRQMALEAYAHQDLPFEKLVEALNPQRHLKHNPLFQVMFALQNAPSSSLTLPKVQVRPFDIEATTAHFDLMLNLYDQADGLEGEIEYDQDLFEEETIKRLIDHYQQVLMGIASDPNLHLSTLPLLTEVEQEQLHAWNATAKEYPQDTSLHELFEQQVDRTPAAVALAYEQEQMTYSELNRRANQLAAYLRRLGIGPERAVGICMERSVEMVVGLLGILKAGGAYLPLDPSYPRERLAFMLADAQVSVVLTQEPLMARLPQQSAQVICLDQEWGAIAHEHGANLAPRSTPAHLAYIIYTSGSTGKPKGVMVAHRSICNRLFWMQDVYQLQRGERVLQKTPLSFDVSVWEFFWPLLTGARLVVARPGGHQESAYLVQVIREEEISTLHFVPSMLSIFLQEEGIENCGCVKRVICSGETLPLEVQERFFGRMQAELHNLYGPTEAAVDVTSWSCKRASEQESVPIGRPIANIEIFVLDRYGNQLPLGVPGELHIAGVGLARGYVGHAELTAERFLPHPYSTVPGARLYKTGDLVRYREDGAIEFLGRMDQQVKLRGVRIELGEIAVVLEQHPAIREAVTVAREDRPGDQQLVAYLVSQSDQTLSSADLRHYLKVHLPAYMLPSTFVWLDALPLTPNGKMDRKALPPPAAQDDRQDGSYKPPITPLEEVLATLWENVLGRASVGRYDNFFALGGHSLLATQVVARLRTILQVEVPLRSLFAPPTIAGIAAHIEAALHAEQRLPAPPPLRQASREGHLPLSFAQQRLWFLDQFEPHNPFYNISDTLLLKGRLDWKVLEQSLGEIVRRHEALRTTFATYDGQPVQIITAAVPFSLLRVDLTALKSIAKAAEVQCLAVADAQRPFDLTQSPLISATVLRLATDEHLLLLNMHHIASDGWSSGIFVGELTRIYTAFVHGHPSPLPALPIQYADFASWQRQWLHGEVLQQHLDYWKAQLEDAPAYLDLPLDHPHSSVQRYRGALQQFQVPQDVYADLKQLSQREGVTLFMTLLAAFSVLLARYSGQEDLLVGTPIANRTQADLEHLIGFFINMLVLRIDLSGNPPFCELLRRVRAVALDGYVHQDLPFEQLVEALQPQRELSRSPLFQVSFVLQNMPLPLLQLEGLTLQQVEVEHGTSKYDLTLFMREQDGALEGAWEYNTDRFEAATVRRMERHFQRLLAGIVAQPEQRLGSLPLLTALEWQQMVIGWNATQTTYPHESCLHQLIEEQVELFPQAIAVMYEGEQLTYAELNKRANQLARYLQKLGVGPEVCVGLYLERSLEMMVGLLAILKAGGAYLPLDTASPPQRVSFMVADAQVSIILTQQRLAAQWAEQRIQIICLDAAWETTVLQSEQNPESRVQPENLAYVIYTSGSTGKPKGTMISHRGLVNYLKWCTEAYRVEGGCGAPVHTSIGFDLTITSLFSPLLMGQSVTMLAESPGVESLQDALSAGKNFSLVKITPSHLEMLQQVLPAQEVPEAVHALIIGGEALRAEDLVFWRTHAPAIRLINEYGPTETVVGCCIYEVPVDASLTGAVPIGRPIANTDVYVLDKQWEVVPVGVRGELYIGGDGLARGYLNSPAMTAERFLPHPFSTIPGARLYRTGDVACYRPDGNLMFLGRIDHQVKMRGYRIELGEIEAALASHPAVRESVVQVRDALSGGQRLVAYVIPDHQYAPQELEATQTVWGTEQIVPQLRRFMLERLPDYMVPTAFMLLDALPLTTHGKVDRQALPAPDQVRPELGDVFVAARNPVEEVLVTIWAELLGIEQPGVHDNFFALGGHSLLATQVAARVRDAFQIDLPLRTFFEAPTVAGLAAALLFDPKVMQAAELIIRLSQLSDEEVEAMLHERFSLSARKGERL